MGMFSLLGTSFSNMFHKPATKMYPTKDFEPYPATRGVVEVDIDLCILCGLCAKNCPVDALKVSKKPEQYWSCDAFHCIRCGECVARCPKHCLSMDPFDKYVATSKISHRVDKPLEEPKDEVAAADASATAEGAAKA